MQQQTFHFLHKIRLAVRRSS